MKSLPVKLPVIINTEDLYGESGAETYGESVSDFLSFYSKRKVKYKFVGYSDDDAILIFYTNASSPDYKKLYKKAKEKVERWRLKLDEECEVETRHTYCTCCERQLRD